MLSLANTWPNDGSSGATLTRKSSATISLWLYQRLTLGGTDFPWKYTGSMAAPRCRSPTDLKLCISACLIYLLCNFGHLLESCVSLTYGYPYTSLGVVNLTNPSKGATS